MHLSIVDVTDVAGLVVAPDWLLRAERVHRQLRPQMSPAYAAQMERIFAGGGRMSIAAEGEVVRGVAVFRVYENTFEGLQMYVDDLVTDETSRSAGVGRALLEHLQRRAAALECVGFNLDSGVQRSAAHKFYFREGMVATAFHFWKPVR